MPSVFRLTQATNQIRFSPTQSVLPTRAVNGVGDAIVDAHCDFFALLQLYHLTDRLRVIIARYVGRRYGRHWSNAWRRPEFQALVCGDFA